MLLSGSFPQSVRIKACLGHLGGFFITKEKKKLCVTVSLLLAKRCRSMTEMPLGGKLSNLMSKPFNVCVRTCNRNQDNNESILFIYL